jgi:hypothetical protein
MITITEATPQGCLLTVEAHEGNDVSRRRREGGSSCQVEHFVV